MTADDFFLRDHYGARRRHRIAHQALGQILEIGERDDLPAVGMNWLITEWSVVGQCKQDGDNEAADRRAAFNAWSNALDLSQRAERPGLDGVIELRASAKGWRGHHLLGVSVWADLLPELDGGAP